MSATVPTPKQSFIDGLSITNAALALVVSVAVAGATWGGIVARVGAVEKTVTDNKAEREKALDEIKVNMIGRERYEADMKAVERIERTVQEIRRDQIDDLRRRANTGK